MKPRIFKDAGVLLGFVIGSLSGIIVAVIKGIMVLIGDIGTVVTIPTGLFLKNKFQGIQSEQNRFKSLYTIDFLGICFVFVCFFLAK